MAANVDASISEGANLIKQRQYHAAIALLEKVAQENNSKSQEERAKRFAEKAMQHLSSDPYQALNLPKRSSRKDVKKTYRKLALKYHPDKNKYTADLFKVISGAYDKLKDKPTPKKGQAFSKPAPPPRRSSRRSNSSTSNSSSSSTSNNSNHHYAKYKNAKASNNAPPPPPRPKYYAKYHHSNNGQHPNEPKKPSFFRPANEARPAGTSSKHSYNSGTTSSAYPRPPWRNKPKTSTYDDKPKSARAGYSTYDDKPKSARAGYTNTSYDYYTNMPNSARSGYEESKKNAKKERTKPKRARDMPGFPERKPDYTRSKNSSSSSSSSSNSEKYPYSTKYNKQYQKEKYNDGTQKPTPTPDTFDGINSEDFHRAEEAMKQFWETGEFPFSFAKNDPAKAADIFAKMFQQQTPEQRTAFKNAFAKKFNNVKATNAWMGVNQPRVWRQRPKEAPPLKRATNVFNGVNKPTSGRSSTGGLPTPRVTGLQMHEAADNSVVLLWNTVCQGVSEGLTNVLYELQFREFGAKHWSVSSDTIRTTTVRKKGLKPGTRYEFRVRARACGKEGTFSQSIAVRTESGIPSPPHIDNILEVKSTSVRITWSCKECNGAAVRQYELQWRHVGSINWQTASATLKGTDCRKKNLLSNRRYEFRVRAMNRVGWSGWSGAVGCSTTIEDPTENVKKNVEEKKEEKRSNTTSSNKSNSNVDKNDKNKSSEDKLAEWIRLKKKEQLEKEKLEEKKKRLERLEKEEKEQKMKEEEETKKESGNDVTATNTTQNQNMSTPIGKKQNKNNKTVLPTEYYEMIDADGNTYYWNAVTGSDWNPPTWLDCFDENHNIYYENTETGESVWECPLDFINIIRNDDGMPFDDGNIGDQFVDENDENDDYNIESPLDDVLFSPGEKKMMESIYVETSGSNASPFAKQAMKNAMNKTKMKKSSLRHSFKPPNATNNSVS